MDVLQYSRRSGFLYIDTPLTRAACKKFNWANYFVANDDDGGQRWTMIRRQEDATDDYQAPFYFYNNWFMDTQPVYGEPDPEDPYNPPLLYTEYYVNSDRNTYLIRNLHVSININFNPEPRRKLIDLYDCKFDLVIVPMPPIDPQKSRPAFEDQVNTLIGRAGKFSIKNFNLASRRRNRIKNTFSLDFSHKDVFVLYPYDSICLFCHADASGTYPLDVNVQARVTFDYVIV